MTHLQQTCADMVASQEQLQRLYAFERRVCQEPVPQTMFRAQLRYGIAVHTEFLSVCAKALQRHPAANDATILPESA